MPVPFSASGKGSARGGSPLSSPGSGVLGWPTDRTAAPRMRTGPLTHDTRRGFDQPAEKVIISRAPGRMVIEKGVSAIPYT